MSKIPQENIRNFSIIAHIDHGKSTLADQLLLQTGTITEREFENQLLDDMDLEKERGITIKAKSVSMNYMAKDGQEYLLNLIDTPGHVDFAYEVSRSLSACEGALLVVDACQGVEAQTVANTFLALENDLEILPVLNKIDVSYARPEEVSEELDQTFGFPPEGSLAVSAKTGLGVPELLEHIVAEIPSPTGDVNEPLQALIFDSHYDSFRGVIIYVNIKQGVLKSNSQLCFMSGSGKVYEVDEVGMFKPRMEKCDSLQAGEVGYLVCNIKTLNEVKIGDTITTRLHGCSEALPGFKNPQPMVFCGVFPTNPKDFVPLRSALDKLWLNDCSFSHEPEASTALGSGFRCGFLGLLHMEIVQERLERESGIDVVQTAPTVTYELLLKNEKTKYIESPADLPDLSTLDEIREPIVFANLLIPAEFIGTTMKLLEEKRGQYQKTDYISKNRVQLTYEVPLAEIIVDFYDKYKSSTRGYGTLDYELQNFRSDDLVKLDILVNGELVDALSMIVHRQVAERRGRALLKRLKTVIPRHMFQVPLQAAIGARIVARESIKAMSKNVTAKCYGGDVSRKRKLLEKQKEGKKRMKQIGNVTIPQDAFLAVLRLNEEE